MVIVAFGLLAHAPLLLTDYLLWDGWLYDHDLSRVDGPTHLVRLFSAAGRPLDALFYLPFRWFPDKAFLSKFLSVLCWMGSSVLTYCVLLRLVHMPSSLCLGAGVLTATAPIFPLLGEISLWMYVACVFLFWLAWTLVSFLPATSGPQRMALRIATACLFVLSFNLNSLLVMFYAFALFVCAATTMNPGLRSVAARVARGAWRHPELTMLPIAFWIWKTTCTPTHGLHAGYNQPSLDPALVASGYATMVVYFLIASLVAIVMSPYALALFAACVAAFSTRRARSWFSTSSVVSYDTALGIAAWGGFLLAAAAFPYIVVGQPVVGAGWLSRNCILCPLPVAMMSIGALIAINRTLLPARPDAWQPIVFALGAMSAALCADNYLVFQGYGAKELSLQRALVGAIEKHSPCVVQLRDNVHIRGELPYYPPIVWTYLAAAGRSPLRTFVIETTTQVPDRMATTPSGEAQLMPGFFSVDSKILDEMIIATLMPYAMTQIPRTGPHILVHCAAGRGVAHGRDLGLSYLYYYWIDPHGKNAFLDSLVECTVASLPPVTAP